MTRSGRRQSLGLPFAVLCSVPFVMVLSNSMLIPVLPAIRSALDTTAFRAGLLITAFSVPAGVVIPFAGTLSDYVGRKAVIVPALVLFGLGGLMAGLAGLLAADPYPWMLGGRIIQGVGGGGTYQIALALAGDAFRKGQRARAMGILEASNALGKVVSPILGGAVALLSWFAPFFVYPVLAWLSAGAVAWLAEEPKPGARQRLPLAGYLADLRQVWENKGALLGASFFVGGLMLFMLFGVLSWFSDELEARFRQENLARGLIIAVPVLVAAVTSWAVGSWWLRRRQRAARPAVLAGTLLVVAALAGLFFNRMYGAAAETAVISALGLGYGLTLPAINTLVTGATGSSERGLVTALYGTVRFMGAAFGPPSFNVLTSWDGRLAFIVAAAVTAAAWVAALLAIRRPDPS